MKEQNNITTGTKAEEFVAQELSKLGVFVGTFYKSPSGDQPFDQVAIESKRTWCYDVKHCKTDRFDFSRVESNQLSALNYIQEIDNINVICGIAIVFDDEVYFLSWYSFSIMKAEGRKSVKPSELTRMLGAFKYE